MKKQQYIKRQSSDHYLYHYNDLIKALQFICTKLNNDRGGGGGGGGGGKNCKLFEGHNQLVGVCYNFITALKNNGQNLSYYSK